MSDSPPEPEEGDLSPHIPDFKSFEEFQKWWASLCKEIDSDE